MSNLAIQVRTVFQRLNRKVAAEHQHVTLLPCWQGALNTGDGEFYEALALVESAIQRLAFQIGQCTLLDDESKSTAYTIIEGLKECMKPQHFNQQARAFADKFSSDRLGSMGFLGSALRADGDEKFPPREEMESIRDELEDLRISVGEAKIATTIKALLLRHITFMIWALQNIDIVGATGVYDVLAKTMLMANEIPDNEKAGDSKDLSLKLRLKNIGSRIYSVVRLAGVVDRDLNNIQKLGHDGLQAIDHVSKLIS